MNFWRPLINNATPSMDMYKLQRRLYKCTEANSERRISKKLCKTCPYNNTTNCWQRLMLDSAHAIKLLLDERDRGLPLIVEGED